jgi:3-dehydroquinate synthase
MRHGRSDSGVETLRLVFRSRPRHVCTVSVGAGALERLVADLVGQPPAHLLVIVSDDGVGPLYAAPVRDRLRAAGLRAELVTFPAGESSKTRERKAEIEDRLSALGAGRDTAIVAVGGGVACDLAGFVAATWHRGVPVVQVPTSLLAMADAGIGGKTAVNLPAGKNLVGCFHQPLAVYADVETLATLPEASYVCGLAEIVKAAVIADAPLFGWIARRIGALVRREPAALEHVVRRALRIKGRVVVRDERESGRRAILNFGHTVGHAIEAATDWEIPHGRAVAIGMCAEARLAAEVTGFPRSDVERLETVLSSAGLPTAPGEDVAPERVARALHADKKARAGRARYALPLRIGKMPGGDDVTVEVGDDRVRAVLEAMARD